MRRKRNFIGFTLIVLIFAGLAYIGYSIYYNPELLGMLGFNKSSSHSNQNANNNNSNNGSSSMNGMDMSGGSTSSGMSGMPGMSGGSMNNSSTGSLMENPSHLGQLALKNKDKLTQFITLLTDAVNQITLDPYSSITTQSSIPDKKSNHNQGSVQIYPNGTSTVNVTPEASKNNHSSAQTDTTAQKPAVMSQSRLQQLHEGIFKLSQGMMMANDLNNDLIKQSGTVESSPPSYQTYMTRYTTLVLNRTKLNNALGLLNSASTLVNINPYGQNDGYGYDPEGMEVLHNGIYKLAQAMGLAASLSSDLTAQISNASYDLSNFNSMGNMNMNGNNGFQIHDLFSFMNLSNIMTWVLVLLTTLFGIGLLGTLLSLMFSKKKPS